MMEYGCGVRNRYELFANIDAADPAELIEREEERRRLLQAERHKHKLAESLKNQPAASRASAASAAVAASVGATVSASGTAASRAAGREIPNKVEGQRQRDSRGLENRKSRDANHEASSRNGVDTEDRRFQRRFAGGVDRSDAAAAHDSALHPRPTTGRPDFVRGPLRTTRGPRREPADAISETKADSADSTTAPRQHAPNASERAADAGADSASATPQSPSAVPADAAQAATAAPAKPQETDGNKEDAGAATEGSAVASVEPEVPEKTLEQWKKELEARKSKTTYNATIRKPNEGEGSDPKWAQMKAIRKKKDNDEISTTQTGGSAHKDSHKDSTAADAKVPLDEDGRKLKRLEETLSRQFHFSDPRAADAGSRPPGQRGGRGGRGGGYRSAMRPKYGGGHPPQQQPPPPITRPTPRVEDLNDFPTLSA